MSVNVPYEIAAFPNALSWKAGKTTTPKEFKVKIMGDKPINRLSYKSSSPKMRYKVEEVIKASNTK